MDFEKAMRSPSDEFADPDEVVESESLSQEQKIKLLENWEADLLELMTAEAENMPSDKHIECSDMMQKIHNHLVALKA